MTTLKSTTGIPVHIKIGSDHFPVTIDDEPVLLGREVADLPRKIITIFEADDYISRQHCQLWYERSTNKLCCKNLSTNGATLNSTLLKAGETSKVSFNKPIELLLGKTCLQIERQRVTPQKTVRVDKPEKNNSSPTPSGNKIKQHQDKTARTGSSKITIVTLVLFVLGVAVAGGLFFFGTSESKRLYTRAVEVQLEQGIEQAIVLYQEVVTRYPDSQYGQYAAENVREYEEKLREQAEIARLAKEYGKNAGKEIMEAVGGGQDLRVIIKDWNYEEYASRYEIAIEVYFHGAMVRANEYHVNGELTIDRDGSNGSFARTFANARFQDVENMLNWVGVVVVLGELSE